MTASSSIRKSTTSGTPIASAPNPKQRELTFDIAGRQSLDHGNHIRLLLMGGRALQAVIRQNSEPSWTAYLGIQFLLGPEEKEIPGQNP